MRVFFWPWTSASDSLCGFWVGSLFKLKWLVSSGSDLVPLKRGAIFLKSDLPLCLDDFMVTLPYGLVTKLYSLQLGLRPEAAPNNAVGGSYFLPEPLSCGSDSHLLRVWTGEMVPGGWFWVRVSHVLPQLILDGLVTTVIGVGLIAMFLSTPRGNHVIVGHLQWCFGQFPFALWGAMSAACIGLCGFSMGPLARLTIGCAAGVAILLFVQESMMNPISGHLTRGMSDMGRMGRGGVQVWHAGLLEEAGAYEPLDSGVVVAAWASALYCMGVAMPHSCNIWESYQD